MFRKLLIAGVGLIGGSLALDARKHGLAEEIIGYGRPGKNLKWAKQTGVIDDFIHTPEKTPEGIDLLVLATPVETVVPLARTFFSRLASGCLITDVGSVKEKIVREMEASLPPRFHFIGAHPIAGNEQWGAQAAREDLFQNRKCILTPTNLTDRKALAKLRRFWQKLGAEVILMNPKVHDQVLAVVSHLPHVLVYALVNTLGRTRVDSIDLKEFCAGGFKDFTRIASSRPELWRDIFLLNRRAVSKGLADYIRSLERLKRMIDNGQGAALEKEFALANEARRRIS